MNGPVWIGWVLVIVMSILSVVLLMGKGSFLIAGYNTSSKEEKEKYNEKRLCRVVGCGLGIITIMVAISLFYKNEYPIAILNLMMPWGLFIVIAIMIILCNTICKKR